MHGSSRKGIIGLGHFFGVKYPTQSRWADGAIRLVAQGVDPKRRRLFVIDASKALRTAINAVFGKHPVQGCKSHKLRNVLARLPRDQPGQTG